MKQSFSKKERKIKGFKLISLLLLAAVFVVGKTDAQESPISLSSAEESNVSDEKLLNALGNGGLSSGDNFGEKIKAVVLGKDTQQDSSETNVALPSESAESGFEAGRLNSDTFEYLEAQGGLVAGSSDSKVDSGEPTVFKLAAKFLDKVVFKNYADFFKKATFEDGFEVSGQPIFDQDTAGFAVIKKESQSVKVNFDKKYKAMPVVTVSLSVQQYDDPEVRAEAEDLLLVSDVKYVVTNVTQKGFEIKMDRQADSDIPFSWHALAVKDPAVSSRGPKPVAGREETLEKNFDPSTDPLPEGGFVGVLQQESDVSSGPENTGEGSTPPLSGGNAGQSPPSPETVSPAGN